MSERPNCADRTLAFTSGCSLVLVDGPRDFIVGRRSRRPRGVCTTETDQPFAECQIGGRPLH